MDHPLSSEQSVLPLADVGSARPLRSPRAKRTPQMRKTPRSIESHILGALSDPARVLFLDVETTGLSKHYDDLTLVGWLLDGVYRVHVALLPIQLFYDLRFPNSFAGFRSAPPLSLCR
jgi:uncharacterized protein YprB with RNaseH-like and TPR domain